MSNSLLMKNSLRAKDKNEFHTWLNHIEITDLEEEKRFIAGLRGHGQYWNVLNKIIEKMYEGKANSNYAFDTPNWMEKEVFNKGYLKALEDVYKIIPKTPEDK